VKALPWLSLITFLPLLGGCLLLLLPGDRKETARRFGLGVAFLTLLLGIAGLSQFEPARGGIQLVEQHSWIPGLSVEYYLGVDGLGLLMVALTLLLVPFALMTSWRIESQVRLYFALTLFLEAGLLGTFTALNFFHWFIFWELSLIPAFFLIKLWGGPDRSYAATQFFLFTLVGSVAMLLAFEAIFLATRTFDFIKLADLAHEGRLASALVGWVGWLDMPPQAIVLLIFFGVFLGFAVKVPLVPFHIWLPTAYTEAPSPVTMLLTGVMSKMGVYGFMRILLPLFPEQTRMMIGPLMIVVVVTILYSAWAALAQTDLKRILAYSSINHLGYALLGLLAATRVNDAQARGLLEGSAALSGAMLQMFNHGITAAALFCFVALLEARKSGQRGLQDFGGARQQAPVLAGLMGIALFSSLGLPGLNGFVGEFLIFKGTFALVPWAACCSVLALLVTAVFLLTVVQKVFCGPLNPQAAILPDLTVRERWLVAPAVAVMFGIGLYPQGVLHWVNPTVMTLLTRINY